jgi:hypothetical protein
MPFDQGCLMGMTNQADGTMNMPAAQTAACSVRYVGLPVGKIQFDLTSAHSIRLLDSQGNPIHVGGVPPTVASLTSSFSFTRVNDTRGMFNLNLAAIQALKASDPNSYEAIWLGFNQGGQLSIDVRVIVSPTSQPSTPLIVQLRSFRNVEYDVESSVAQPKATPGLPPNFICGAEPIASYTADFTDALRTLQATPFAETDLNLTSTAGLSGTLPMKFRVTRSFQKDSAGNSRNYTKLSELQSSLTFH